MEELKQIKEDYIREIIRYYREHGLTKDSIMVLDTLIHSAKNLCKIYEAYEEENGYSMRGRGSYEGGSYRGSYANNSMASYDGGSYARGRGSNANRDSMGRYSSAGYSGHNDVVNGLYDLMNRTSDEATRQELQNMINRM